MGQQPHPTTVPNNDDNQEPVNTVYLVEDWSEPYYPVTVSIFTDEKTAEDVAGHLENEKGHYRDRRRYKIKERDVHSSAESFFDRR